MNKEKLKRLLERAKGDKPVDLLLKGASIVNVFTGEIYKEDVAIFDEYIVGFGEYKSKSVINLNGKILCPSFIDAHIHVESTFLNPIEFSKIASFHGTCAVLWDPHEIANVMGKQGIELMIRLTEGLNVDFFFMLPSCVPATSLETSGGKIDCDDMKYLFNKYPHKFLGLAEVMNFPGVINKDEEVLDKILISQNKLIDGHAPLLKGKDLNAYLVAGPKSDHECTNREEALEKLRKGMFIFIREGTTEHNLKELLPIVKKENIFRFCLVTDDRHADELYRLGHLDFTIKKAIEYGLDPISAIRMATINPANYMGLKRYGAISPGYYANIVVLNDLEKFEIEKVFFKGKEVSLDGEEKDITDENIKKGYLNFKPIDSAVLKVPFKKGKRIRVIEIVPGQIVTNTLIEDPKVVDNWIVPDIERDIAKVVVIERHKGTGNISIGFVKGLMLKKGAVGSTVAHDSHNLILAGTNDEDIKVAANFLREKGGGIVAVWDKNVIGFLELALGGIMSLKKFQDVIKGLDDLNTNTKELSPLGSKIFMYLSFLALPVIPTLRITDKGLVDVEKHNFVSLYV